MKSYLKGGLIGFVFGILIYFLLELITPPSNLFYRECYFLTNCYSGGCLRCAFITPVMVVLEFGLLGIILWFIANRIKGKSKKNKK